MADKRIIPENLAKVLTDFSIRVFQARDKKGENLIVSPVALFYILGLAASGAKGETLSQIESVIGFNVTELNPILMQYLTSVRTKDNSELNMANALFINQNGDLMVKPDFFQKNKEGLNLKVFNAKSGPDEINEWAEKETRGVIRKVIHSLPDPYQVFLLSAISFCDEWGKPYEEGEIIYEKFKPEKGRKKEKEMMQSEEHFYYEDEKTIAMEKPYKNEQYAFLVLLPRKRSSLGNYVKNLTGEKLFQIMNQMEWLGRVDTVIPIFETETDGAWTEILKNMGMTAAFDQDAADFSGIAALERGNLFFSYVLQKVCISVNEKGTNASGVVIGNLRGGPPQDKEVILNRPFFYMIVDRINQLPLFMGTIRDLPE